jgi:hypothetical protein
MRTGLASAIMASMFAGALVALSAAAAIATPTCPDGFYWDEASQVCRTYGYTGPRNIPPFRPAPGPVDPNPGGEIGNPIACPMGYLYDEWTNSCRLG